MIDPPHPTRERDDSLRATTHRVTVARPRPTRGWIEGRTVTDMVELRKLTRGGNCHFPLWISDFGGEPVLQTSGLLALMSVFGRFLGYQIVPNFTNFCQNWCSEGGAKGLEEAVNEGFLATDLFKPCQVGRLVSRCKFSVISFQLSVSVFQFPISGSAGRRKLKTEGTEKRRSW
jgi:hypothetical protein